MTAAVFASTAMFAASPKAAPNTKLEEKRAMEKLLDDAFGSNVKKPKVEIKVEVKPEVKPVVKHEVKHEINHVVKHEIKKEVNKKNEHVKGPDHRENHKHDNCVHGHRGEKHRRPEIKNHQHRPGPANVKPHVQPKKPVKAKNDR